MMDIEDFEALLSGAAPALLPPLLALWHAARGDGKTAHRIVAAESSADAAWVHAFLHRREGELDNARYWYRRAQRPEPEQTPEEERAAITAALLAGSS